MWDTHWFKDIVAPVLTLIIALGSLAIGVRNCVAEVPRTRFQQIDAKIERVDDRLREADVLAGTVSSSQPELGQELNEAEQQLFQARSAWLDGDLTQADQLLAKADTHIRHVFTATAPPAGKNAPNALLVLPLALAVSILFGGAVLAWSKIQKRRRT